MQPNLEPHATQIISAGSAGLGGSRLTRYLIVLRQGTTCQGNVFLTASTVDTGGRARGGERMAACNVIH
jgi:hypothetical protein